MTPEEYLAKLDELDERLELAEISNKVMTEYLQDGLVKLLAIQASLKNSE